MKIKHFPILGKKYAFVCAFLILSIFTFGQTTLVNFPFNNSSLTGGMTYAPNLQTAPPTIVYYNANGTVGTPTYNNGRLKANDIGDYLEIQIDTRGFSNISLDFDAAYRYNAIIGTGTWTVSANMGNGFQNQGSITLSDSGITSAEDTGHYSRTLPAAADNNQNLKIRIASSDFSILGTSYLYIDNIIIRAGNAIIGVVNASNTTIPHESLASYLYDTDFGTVLTSSGSVVKTYTIKNTGSIALNIISIVSNGQNSEDFIVSDIPSSVPVNSSRTFKVTFDPSNDGIRSSDIVIYSNSAPNPYQFNVQGRGVSCAMEPSVFKQNSFGTGTPSLPTIGNYAAASGSSGNTYRPNSTNMYYNNNSDTRSWITNSGGTTLEFGPIDISNEKNVSISFHVAAFTTGSSGEGVNNGSTIILSVWNPVKNEWSEEMKLIGSGSSGTKYHYPFFNSTQGLFESIYDGNNQTVNKTNSGDQNKTAGKIGKFKLNIPNTYGAQLRFKIKATTSGSTRYWLIDEVNVNTENTIFKTFTTNNSWSPSAPSINEKAIIEGNLNLTAGTYNYCECEVKDGGSLNLAPNSNLILQGKLINEGIVTIQNDANLIQKEDAAKNIGSITQEKLFTFVNGDNPSNDRKQYNFVISPLVGQNIKTIYPGNPAVIEHRETTNKFHNHNGNYTAGKGFAIKEPTKTAVPNSTVTAKFNGVPFNGVLEYPISYTVNSNGVNPGYNLIGNPYPSNLDLELFYEDNKDKIEPTFYFWDNRGNTQYTQQGSSYNGSNYALYNAVSGTGVGIGTKALGATGTPRIPNQFVKVGTAFLVQAKSTANGQSVIFKNAYRSGNNSGPGFFGKGNNLDGEKDRFWISLQSPSELEFMAAVVYLPYGSNELGIEDTEANGSSEEIFTLAEGVNLAIQGRAQFENTDSVPLGIRIFNDGIHQISLHHVEGIFANGQKIYLKDKETGRIHDLTKGPFEFEARKGEISNRFHIVYRVTTKVRVSETPYITKNEVTIWKKDFQIEINSSLENIREIELFNLNGTSIEKFEKVNSKEFYIKNLPLQDKIIIINVKTESGELISKKLMNF